MNDITRRKSQRFEVAIGVTLHLPTGNISTKTKNISIGGAEIEAPFLAHLVNFDAMKSLTLVSIGKVAVTVVWQTGNSVGLKFDFPQQTEKMIVEYLNKNGHI